MQKSILIILQFIVFLYPFFLNAQKQELTRTNKLEVIGVKEESSEKTGSTKLDPSGFTESIKSEDFKGRYTSLPDVLERETGVRVRRFGGLGSYSTLSIRGSNPNQVKIYIDGIPLNNSQGGEVNLSDLNFDNLERIDIYKSGVSSGFSGSAIGGTVNLITNKNFTKPITRVNVAGGSFNTYKLSASRMDKIGDVRYSLFVQKEKSDQDFKFKNDNGTRLNPTDDKDIKRRNAQFDRYSFTGNVNFQIRKTDFQILNDFNYRTTGIPGIGNNQTQKVERQYVRNTTSVTSSSKGIGFDNLQIDTRTFYTGARDHLFDPLQEFSYGTPNSKADIQQFGFHLLPTIYANNINQIFRFLIANEKETFRRDKRDKFDEIQDRTTRKFRTHTTIQLTDEIKFFNKKLILTPSVQKEIYMDRFNDLSSIVTIGPGGELPQNKKMTEFNNLRFGLLFVLNKTELNQLSFKANASKENRIPDFMEIFGERGSIIGNSSLKPERSKNTDIGLVNDYRNKNLTAHGTFSFFRRTIQDMILFIPNSQFTLKPENIDSADIKGFEFSLKFLINNKLKIQSNYTYQKAINTSSVSYLNGKYLPLRPLHEWHGLLSYRFNKIELGFEPVFIGASFRDRTNEYSNYQPSRWIYNLFLNWEIMKETEKNRELLLGVDIKNITDFRAYDIIGYPLPGRYIYATLSTVF